MNRYFKINLGDTASITHTITNSDIQKFVEFKLFSSLKYMLVSYIHKLGQHQYKKYALFEV